MKPKELMSNYTDITFIFSYPTVAKTMRIANYFTHYVLVMCDVFIVH